LGLAPQPDSSLLGLALPPDPMIVGLVDQQDPTMLGLVAQQDPAVFGPNCQQVPASVGPDATRTRQRWVMLPARPDSVGWFCFILNSDLQLARKKPVDLRGKLGTRVTQQKPS